MNNIVKLYEDLTLYIKPWACSFCTFLNTKHYNICEICNNEDNNYNIINRGEYRKTIDKNKKIENIFRNKKILLPVLSCFTIDQFKQNIIELNKIYREKKIDGIIISSYNSSTEYIEIIIEWIRSDINLKNIWLGISLINENIFKTLQFIKKYNPDGIFIDNPYLQNENIANLILDQLEAINWHNLYFGGVMFKYQQKLSINEYKKIINNCNKYIDVLMTSGSGTGIEIDLDKLKFINNENNNKMKISIASGITSDNIYKYKKYCDIFIVCSSIIDKEYNIDLEKINILYKYII
jgi:hypothetical protein